MIFVSLQKIIRARVFVALAVLLVWFSGASIAHAASLYITPSNGAYNVGQTFSAGVYVSSQDQTMNAASGIISFPADKLQIDSLSKEGSVMNLWVQEPFFSNTAGTLSFEGVALNPGFSGLTGKILSATFKVKAVGAGTLAFTQGSILANDGLGTNILDNTTGANLSLQLSGSGSGVSVPSSSIGSVPNAPEIVSSTHQDSNKWYSNGVATFTWPAPNDITAVKLLVGSLPKASPVVLYRPPINKKTIDDLGDGIWYFHAQLQNDSGFGTASHFQFRIDTTKPDKFNISFVERKDNTNPRVELIFDSHDETSGIDHYEIQIDKKDSYTQEGTGYDTVEILSLEPGKHIISAKAVDKAGNFLQDTIEIDIDGLSPPIITDYPEELSVGKNLTIRGSTYPDSKVTIYLQKDSDEPKIYEVQSENKGQFTFTTKDGLSRETYNVWADVSDERGVRSGPSDTIIFVVKEAEFLRIGTFALDVFSIFVPLLVLLILSVFIIWYSWHKFINLKREVRKDIRKVDARLHKVFDLLKEDIMDEIKLVEHAKTKRELTKEEKRLIKRLREDLEDAEKFIKKELKEIEEDVE